MNRTRMDLSLFFLISLSAYLSVCLSHCLYLCYSYVPEPCILIGAIMFYYLKEIVTCSHLIMVTWRLNKYCTPLKSYVMLLKHINCIDEDNHSHREQDIFAYARFLQRIQKNKKLFFQVKYEYDLTDMM